MKLILTTDDLAEVVKLREEKEPVVGAVLALEGAHWIGSGDMDTADIRAEVQELFDAEFRMLSPTHRFKNDLGASSEGCDHQAGLTEDGKVFLNEAEKLGIVLDLAHASDTAIEQAMKSRAGPVVVSHTGMRESCDRDTGCEPERNLSDANIKAIADNNCVIGIGIWPAALGHGFENIVKAFKHAYDVLSENGVHDPADHIAIGSDFDDAVKTPFHVGDLNLLTAALLSSKDKEGNPLFDEVALKKIAGANACRVFASRLPRGDEAIPEDICARLLSPSKTSDGKSQGGSGDPLLSWSFHTRRHDTA